MFTFILTIRKNATCAVSKHMCAQELNINVPGGLIFIAINYQLL